MATKIAKDKRIILLLFKKGEYKMWSFIIMAVLGIMLSISNANKWFVVPNFCIWICFGISAVIFVIWLFNLISAKRTFKKMSRRF